MPSPAASPKKIMGQPEKRYRARYPFTYEFVSTTGLTALAGGLILTVNTDQDGDFFWHKGCVFVDVANDATTYDAQLCPNLTVQVNDGYYNRNLSQVPVHVSNYFGVGRLPFIMVAPYYFPARTVITLTVANVSDNTNYSSIRFSMHGIKGLV